MTREEMFGKLGEIFEQSSASELDWSTVTESATIESMGFDSLTILDLLFDLEDALGVKIEAKEILAVKTIGQLLDFLEGRLRGS
jgi:acyl carrier protein